MESLPQFLNMDGYGSYIWPSYALAAVILAGVSLTIIQAHKKAKNKLASLDNDCTGSNEA